ncbi:F0F1 ATP synthase subunit A [Patescibacteria group bacterium]|nr:F0F1 ATP synthase subunit A [Patescibacteria group bacterium]
MAQEALGNNEIVIPVEAIAETHSEITQAEHEVSLAAEPIFHIGAFNVTNSLLNTWLVVFLIIIFSLVLKSKIRKVPKVLQNIFEMIVENGIKLCDSVTGSRDKSLKIFPIAFTLFIFILINNWMGLLPGIGSIGFNEISGSHSVFIPYLRGGTADMNTTLGLALVAVFISNIFGIIAVGGWKYFNKFINLRALAEIPFKVAKDPSVLLVNPIKFFVGLIELVSEIAKVASLSFRLFGNVFAGEVLLSSLAVIFAFGLPIPFMFLELLVGVIQALVFAMLTLVYFSIAITEEEH